MYFDEADSLYICNNVANLQIKTNRNKFGKGKLVVQFFAFFSKSQIVDLVLFENKRLN